MPTISSQTIVGSWNESTSCRDASAAGNKAAGRARDMMAEINSGLGWSDAQWETVNNTVSEAFAKASVAGAFLPCYGPLPSSAEYVRKETTRHRGSAYVRVEDDTTLKLFNLTVKVELSSEQVADDGLSSALLAFRTGGEHLAQVEDEIVFNGYQQAAKGADLSARIKQSETRLAAARRAVTDAADKESKAAAADKNKAAADRESEESSEIGLARPRALHLLRLAITPRIR